MASLSLYGNRNVNAWGGLPAPGELSPYSVSMDVDIDRIEKLSHTQGLSANKLLVTRRDTKFPVIVKTRSRLVIESAALVYNESKSVPLTVESQINRVYGTVLEVRLIVVFLIHESLFFSPFSIRFIPHVHF